MKGCAGAQSPLRFPLHAIVVGSLAIAFAAAPSLAQNYPAHQPIANPFDSGRDTTSDAASPPSSEFGSAAWASRDLSLAPLSPDAHWLLSAESCNSWTESASHGPTVSVARLAVPSKASGQYQKGCGALKDKKLEDAEEHERNAIKLYPDYAAAWVVLGQVLEAENKLDDGREACSQARAVDPNYVAPYLCLADFAVSEENWAEVSTLSGSALTLDPTGNAYSFYYASDAAFHMGNLDKAEKDAHNSVKLDKWHHLPQIHLLLAEIYKARGDSVEEAAQLREYLKMSPSAPNTAGVKSSLANLEAKSAQQP